MTEQSTYYVRNFDNADYDLITDSQDITATLSHIGLFDSDFGFLITKQLDGEFVEVYGCSYALPFLNHEVTKLV